MMRYCPHCWQEIAPFINRCPHCGQSTDESDQDFVSKLIAALKHPEPTRAGLAIDILAHMLREPRAVQPLIDLLRTTEDAWILTQAVRGLGALDDVRAVDPLIRLLDEASQPLVARREAVLALGKIGGEAAIRVLERVRNGRPSLAKAAETILASQEVKISYDL
jgi:HEAT repeat protein